MQPVNQTIQRWSTVKSLKAILPAWMPRLAFAPPGQEPTGGHVLVVIFQRGGMDGISAVIPIGDANYYTLRRKLAIAEPNSKNPLAAIDIDGYFAFHPALGPLKSIYDDGMLAPIHAVGSPYASHSHFDAMDSMERGAGAEAQSNLGTGWLGRHLASLNTGNQSPLRAVGMGSILQAALRGPVPVTVLQSIADFHLKGRTQELPVIQQALLALYAGDGGAEGSGADDSAVAQQRTMRELDTTLKLLSQLDATQYQPAHSARYPDTEFGLGLMQVAQLIKAGVGLEVACLDIGGWDTHAHQGAAHGELADLLTELAEGMAALFADLGDGMKTVTVVTMSEFGRRAQENGSGGTDHGHANAMFLMGGGVVGRQVHGNWPTLAPDKLTGPGDLAMTTDYRDVLSEVLSKRMGNTNVAAVFPGFTPTPTYRGVIRADS